MPQFPPDQDLGPDDGSITTVIAADTSEEHVAEVIANLRSAMRCDIILLAVPPGKGTPFLSGLAMAMQADGGLVRDLRRRPHE